MGTMTATPEYRWGRIKPLTEQLTRGHTFLQGPPLLGCHVIHKEFNSRLLWWLLPPVIDFIYVTVQEVLGKRYSFDFPFCPNCPPDRFRLKPIRLTSVLAIFEGACQPFLDLLPFSAPGPGETSPHWFERKFRWLTYNEMDGPGKRR